MTGIKRLTNFGLELKSGQERRRAKLLNLALILALITAALFSTFFVFLAPKSSFPVYLVNLLSFSGYLALYLTHRWLATSIAMWIAATVLICQVIVVSILFGTSVLNQVFILGLPVLTVLIAADTDLKSIVVATLLATIIFVALNSLDIPGLADNFSTGLHSQIQTSNIIATFAVSFVIALYYRISARRAEADAERARDRSDGLLEAIFPNAVADRLKAAPGAEIAEKFENATVLFADIVGFTNHARILTAEELVRQLNVIFSECDLLAQAHGVEKIKTIGDEYFAVSGLSENTTDHADRMLRFAIALCELTNRLQQDLWPGLQLRIALHSGPVIAGVIGKSKFSYDVWGDTVNYTARLVRHCHPGEILASEAAYSVLRDEYRFDAARPLDLRDVGEISAYPIIFPNNRTIND